MTRQPRLSGAERAACSARAETELAELIRGLTPPALQPRPRVKVVVGKTADEVRPPRRPGGPFRIFLSRASLRGPVDNRRWVLAHELAHVCLGHEDPEVRRRKVRPFALWVAGLLTAGVGVGVGLGVAGYPRGVWGTAVIGVVWIALAVGWAPATRAAARTLADERAADSYAAAVVGVAMPAALSGELAERQATWTARAVNRWWRTHPPAAERYQATQAMLAERSRAGVGSVRGNGW